MIIGHGGNVAALARQVGCPVDQIIDMSCNLNPLGPPEGLEAFLIENIAKIRALPSPDAAPMVEAFCNYHRIDTDRVLAGNGTTWFLYSLPGVLKTRHMLIAGPTYADYEGGCSMHHAPFSYTLAGRENNFEHDLDKVSAMLSSRENQFDTVVFCNPNNPTGTLIHKLHLLKLAAEHKDVFFIIDESYLPFVDHADSLSLVAEDRFDNLVVLSSMSKIFRIPGLRTGFICAHPRVIQELMADYQPWSVNSLAQSAIVYLFENPQMIDPFIRVSRAYIDSEKKRFYELIDPNSEIELYPSKTYFILARLTGELSSEQFCTAVGQNKILIRDCANFHGLTDQYVRFSLGKREINDLLVQAIARATETFVSA